LCDAIAVEPSVRWSIGGRFPANPQRAEELRTVLSHGEGGFNAASVWPNLKLAIFWRSMMLRPYLQLLGPFLRNVPQRDYITMASEGIIAIPLEDGVSGGALAVDTHFYEFIPEEYANLSEPSTLLSHELEVGRNYVVVLTTSAGLYRYIIEDVVQVSHFIGSTPVLEFRYRYGNTCSLTGEKLTEDQVAIAVSTSSSFFGLRLKAFTLCPVNNPFPHYALISELNTASDRNVLKLFLEELDRELSRVNIEYRSKRASRRLGSPEFWIVRPGSFSTIREKHIANGASDAQVKFACLTRNSNWPQQFEFVEQIQCESPA
jgi:hypothetical protein